MILFSAYVNPVLVVFVHNFLKGGGGKRWCLATRTNLDDVCVGKLHEKLS